MIFCTKCGTQNDDTAKFCSSCGSPLEVPAAPTIEPAAAPPPAPPVNAFTPPPAAGAPPMAPPPMAAPGMAPPPMAVPGQVPPMQNKPYKAEFIMGLIGSIIAIPIFLIMLVTGIDNVGYSVFGALTIVGSIFCLVAFILGFVGSSQVNKGNGSGGIMLTIAGGLGFIAMVMAFIPAGWSVMFFFPLLLAAGIMALARKKGVESGRF